MKQNKKKKKQQEGENKHYFSYMIRIIYSNGLDFLTISSGVAKLSQRAQRTPRLEATKNY